MWAVVSTSHDLIAFAHCSVKQLKDAVPGTHTSGIVRVDIMHYIDRLVVNEFESLEAMSSPKGHSAHKEECQINQLQIQYWFDLLSERLALVINSPKLNS